MFPKVPQTVLFRASLPIVFERSLGFPVLVWSIRSAAWFRIFVTIVICGREDERITFRRRSQDNATGNRAGSPAQSPHDSGMQSDRENAEISAGPQYSRRDH